MTTGSRRTSDGAGVKRPHRHGTNVPSPVEPAERAAVSAEGVEQARGRGVCYPGSAPERVRHAVGQVVLSHHRVEVDDAQVETRRFGVERRSREHPIMLEQAALSPLRTSGLAGDRPQRASAVECDPSEIGGCKERDAVPRFPRRVALRDVAAAGSPPAITPGSLGKAMSKATFYDLVCNTGERRVGGVGARDVT
jgi:hypothetical protein